MDDVTEKGLWCLQQVEMGHGRPSGPNKSIASCCSHLIRHGYLQQVGLMWNRNPRGGQQVAEYELTDAGRELLARHEKASMTEPQIRRQTIQELCEWLERPLPPIPVEDDDEKDVRHMIHGPLSAAKQIRAKFLT